MGQCCPFKQSKIYTSDTNSTYRNVVEATFPDGKTFEEFEFQQSTIMLKLLRFSLNDSIGSKQEMEVGGWVWTN